MSPFHPSLLETEFTKIDIFAPVIINQDFILVDGYRRFQADQAEEIPVVQMDLPSVYGSALLMNRNTRMWDDIDCFLWMRWAESMEIQDHGLSKAVFPRALSEATPGMLTALANRKLLPGQAVRILQAPSSTRSFFIEFLSSNVRLNVNETANFVDLTFDLANRWGHKNLKQVFEHETLQEVLFNKDLSTGQRGERLLKAMRSLRYPLQQRKSEQLSSTWQKLNLQKWQAKKGLLLEKGVLELTLRARSQEDLTRQVRELFESVGSPVWNEIWEI